MTAGVAFELVKLFEQNQIEMTLDGGWGVDARLGEQNRPHADLDIVIAYKDVTRLRGQLESKVFVDVTHPDTRECNFVMDDEQGPLIDMHTNTYDPVAHPEYGIDYPLESLKGCGLLKGYPFRCISLEYMVKFHTGSQSMKWIIWMVKLCVNTLASTCPQSMISLKSRPSPLTMVRSAVQIRNV